MYIFFINSSGKCDIFFSNEFNNNSNKKKFVQPMDSTRLNLTHVDWVRLGWTYVMGWVELN